MMPLPIHPALTPYVSFEESPRASSSSSLEVDPPKLAPTNGVMNQSARAPFGKARTARASISTVTTRRPVGTVIGLSYHLRCGTTGTTDNALIRARGTWARSTDTDRRGRRSAGDTHGTDDEPMGSSRTQY